MMLRTFLISMRKGVFNAEYDCQLDASPYLSIDEIKNWIING